MSRPKSVGDQGEYGFTRAAYDEQKDAAKRYPVSFVTRLEPSEQKGVWVGTVEAFREGDAGVPRRVASYRAVWPNSTAISFGAFLYQCSHRVCRMVEQLVKSEEEWDEERLG